jgi:hypothetical protein
MFRSLRAVSGGIYTCQFLGAISNRRNRMQPSKTKTALPTADMSDDLTNTKRQCTLVYSAGATLSAATYTSEERTSAAL